MNCTGDSGYPKLGSDQRGILHIVWHDQTDFIGEGDGTNEDVFYKKYGLIPDSGRSGKRLIS